MDIRALFRLIALAAACVVSSTADAETTQPASALSTKSLVRSLRDLGLRPAGDKGYVQTIPVHEQTLVQDRSSVELKQGSSSTGLAIGRDILVDMDAPQPKSVTAALVFVGYGLPAVHGGRDDFAAQDLRGKIAVYLDATPLFLSPDEAHSARALARTSAERAGALGLVAIDVSEANWRARLSNWKQSDRYLSDASLRVTRNAQLRAALEPAAAEDLFAGSGRDLGALIAAARAGRPLPTFVLAGALTAKVETRLRLGVAEAIVAVLPGADRYLARNSVVVSTASAAALLDLAKDAAAAGPSKRTLVFAMLPDGLSRELAARAVADGLGVRRDTIVAAVHLETSIDRLEGLAVAGASESSLGESLRGLAEAQPAPLGPSNEGAGAAALGFALSGAPAISLAGTGSESWVKSLARAIADTAERPAWRLNSPFAPPAPRAQENLTAPLEMPVGKRPQRILPSYGALKLTRARMAG